MYMQHIMCIHMYVCTYQNKNIFLHILCRIVIHTYILQIPFYTHLSV